MLAIVDYGMGNLRSIYNALWAIDVEAIITSTPDDLAGASGIILPGVGAFADGMSNLRAMGMVEALNHEVVTRGKPYLGVCLGMQFLASESHEFGCHAGLGWISGRVVLIEPDDAHYKVPHMGWNNVSIRRQDQLFRGIADNTDFYFVHSYHFVPDDKALESVTGICRHGGPVTASVSLDHIFGVQFHPEKSQGAGLQLLRNFADFTIAFGRGGASDA